MVINPTIRRQLANLLIEAGTSGVTQQVITTEFRNRAFAKELKAILEDWRKLKYVQKFKLPSKTTRPTTVWRATEKILEFNEPKNR